MGIFGKSEKELDDEMEQNLTRLFKELDAEKNEEKKKLILERIRQTQDLYKDQKKKKAKWWSFS